jgi:hypothetical protein
MLNITEDELRQMVRDVASKLIPVLVSEIKSEFSQGGIGFKPSSSISFEADQKSIKPRVHIYASDTEVDISNMMAVAMDTLVKSRTFIEANGFVAAPLTTRANGNG